MKNCRIVFTIYHVYLFNKVAIHLCFNMAKIYTSYQFYIELITYNYLVSVTAGGPVSPRGHM